MKTQKTFLILFTILGTFATIMFIYYIGYKIGTNNEHIKCIENNLNDYKIGYDDCIRNMDSADFIGTDIFPTVQKGTTRKVKPLTRISKLTADTTLWLNDSINFKHYRAKFVSGSGDFSIITDTIITKPIKK